MKSFKGRLALPLVAAGLALSVPSMSAAHHSFSMFDRTQEVVIPGTIVRWAFNNPHVFVFVQTEDGQVYAMEGSAPPSLINRNPSMNGNTFTVGQPIVAIMCPLHDGRPGGAVGLLITEDGTVYNPSDGGCAASQRANVWPEWIAAGFMSRAEAEAAAEAAAPAAQ